jgi:hypothetical protein
MCPVRAGQANRERHAPPVADHMTPAPALGPIGGIWTVWSPPHSARMEQLETRGRPPFCRRGRIGKNGSTRSHNASGSNAAAMPVNTTSPDNHLLKVLLRALGQAFMTGKALTDGAEGNTKVS